MGVVSDAEFLLADHLSIDCIHLGIEAIGMKLDLAEETPIVLLQLGFLPAPGVQSLLLSRAYSNADRKNQMIFTILSLTQFIFSAKARPQKPIAVIPILFGLLGFRLLPSAQRVPAQP